MDVMLMSNTPLRPAGQVNKEDHITMELPSISPLLPVIGLKKKNIYELKHLYRKCIKDRLLLTFIDFAYFYKYL